MIDHLGLKASDYPAAREFYLKALAPLGIGLVMEVPGYDGIGLGKDGKPAFWISRGEPATGVHLAFSAATRDAVDAFHKAALEAGAKDNGAPGLRPHYHPNYYGAFVIDPNGVNLEAVCHQPE